MTSKRFTRGVAIKSASLFKKRYGKRTDEKCPICLEVNLLLRRNNFVCPVCNYKRNLFYHSDLLGLGEKQEVQNGN